MNYYIISECLCESPSRLLTKFSSFLLLSRVGWMRVKKKKIQFKELIHQAASPPPPVLIQSGCFFFTSSLALVLERLTS